jgi:mono/diheme cytochrome c family protein
MRSKSKCVYVVFIFLWVRIGYADNEMASTDSVVKGHQIYRQYCSGCHGKNAEGAPNWKQPNNLGELPPPPHDKTGHTWRHTDKILEKMITNGFRDPFNKTHRLTMPAFKNILSSQEIETVISFFKTLWTSKQREFQEQENRAAPESKQKKMH